ncbi:hypothetical protein HanPI659440_Chr14g0555271 [Helianthus annuus]|nr:hypothetical protein HanPI659440_Chr14g0555271 [Helianthus annuus]
MKCQSQIPKLVFGKMKESDWNEAFRLFNLRSVVPKKVVVPKKHVIRKHYITY